MADFQLVGEIRIDDRDAGRALMSLRGHIEGLSASAAAVGGHFLSLGRIVETAIGMVAARAIEGAIGRMQGFAMSAIQATAQMQQMQVGLEGLLAREIARGEKVRVAERVLAEESAKGSARAEKEKEKLEKRIFTLTRRIETLTARIHDYERAFARAGEKGKQISESMQVSYRHAQEDLQRAQAELTELLAGQAAQAESAGKKWVTVYREVYQNQKSIAEALPEAQKRAAELMEELAKIAILSPYQLEVVQNTFRLAMAFGFSSREAIDFTKAILNVSAGIGASNEMMGRMAYNFAQIRLQGKVTAMDMRQLAMAGFDLMDVFRFIGEKHRVTIRDFKDFNQAVASGRITWEQFTKDFAEWADKNFGGAAERMSRTLAGLSSTWKDVFVLTLPKLLMPAAERVTAFANKILDIFLRIRESPLLTQWAERIAGAVDRVLQRGEVMLLVFDRLWSRMLGGAESAATGVGGALKKMEQEIAAAMGRAEGKAISAPRGVTTAEAALAGTVAGGIGMPDLQAQADRIVQALDRLAEAVRKFVQGFREAEGPVTRLIQHLREISPDLADRIRQLFPTDLDPERIGQIARGVVEFGLAFHFLQGPLSTAVSLLPFLLSALGGLVGMLGKLSALAPVLSFVAGLLNAFFPIVPILTAIAGAIGRLPVLGPILARIGWLLGVIAPFAPILMGIVGAIGLASLAFAALNRDTETTQKIFSELSAIGQSIWEFAQPIIQAIGQALAREVLPFVNEQLNKFAAWFTEVLPMIRQLVEIGLTRIRQLWDLFGDGIMKSLEGLWIAIKAIVEHGLGAVRELISFLLSLLLGDWEGAWTHLKNFVEEILEMIKGIFTGWLRAMEGHIENLRKLFDGLLEKIGLVQKKGAELPSAEDYSKAYEQYIPPGFQRGGFIPRGLPAIVGERGPELFVPRASGWIFPNEALRALALSGGIQVNVSIGSVGSNVDVEMLAWRIAEEIRRRVR